MKKPLVSVIMPVYNGERYLREAIDSILHQTFTDFEFIIINDGSTDTTEEIILSYADFRIVYVKNETNLQIVESLNKGIRMAKGEYIARMDADDISLPKRFEKQYLFMEEHKNINIVGTWAKTFGNSNYVLRPLTDDCEIKAKLFFDSPFIHPSVMFKAISLSHFKYTKQYNKAEDYGLWLEMSATATFANLPEVLLMYRCHQNQTMHQYCNVQNNIADILRLKMLQQTFEIVPSFDEMQIHNKISNFLAVDIFVLERWLLKLSYANDKNSFLNQQCFNTFLGKIILQQIGIQKLKIGHIVLYMIKSNIKKSILKALFYYFKSRLGG